MKSRSLRAAPIFNKVATAKAQEYSMGIKEQAAQRKKADERADRAGPSGGYEWQRCGARVEIMSLFR